MYKNNKDHDYIAAKMDENCYYVIKIDRATLSQDELRATLMDENCNYVINIDRATLSQDEFRATLKDGRKLQFCN